MKKIFSMKNICGTIAIVSLAISAVSASAMLYFYVKEKLGKYLPTKSNIVKWLLRLIPKKKKAAV